MDPKNNSKARFVTGKELTDLFSEISPFNPDLSLKPKPRRQTILAANANFPFEVQIGAYMLAAASNGGSPLIIQFSGGALTIAGQGVRSLKEAAASGLSRIDVYRLGAKLAVNVAEVYLDMYRPPFVALGLDHFAVPDLREVLFAEDTPGGPEVPCPSSEEIRRALQDAARSAMAWGVPEPSAEDMAAWETYLCSPQYREAVECFLTCIRELRPAWAMIDTENLPPVLNFAITREICQLAKKEDPDIVLEAEYGATGQAGDHTGYTKLKGDELNAFAREVAGFVKYTGARGISYPIGMEHAAPSGEKHDPDVLRLEVVQREIVKAVGAYVPFAQHGGTGASEVARGLVGKNNVNTHFLVTGARSLATHVAKNGEGIAYGRKSACGPSMYVSSAKAIAEACVAKMKECGTFGYFGR
ncbi:MAG TPA: hypothetical protein GXX23_07500 [Firmicutes bacterium]|nr:hypothetical protein [Candidatus Fermentithermobacillaceae bacterium]